MRLRSGSFPQNWRRLKEEPTVGEVGDPKLALGEEYYIRARRVHLPGENLKFVDVSCGRAHSLVLTSRGVFAFGDNSFGQCAVDPAATTQVVGTPGRELQPVQLPTGAKAVRVHCSLDTSFVLTEDGRLYAFGLNEDGQCGTGRFGIEIEPREIEGDTKGVKIAWIGGSTDTPMAISESGELFAWGQNEYGQLGNSAEIQETSLQLKYSRRVGFRFGQRVVSAGSTARSCVAVTENGVLYSWGAAHLGLGPNHMRSTRPVPLDQPLFGDVKVSFVEVGNTSVFAVTEKRQAFSFGQNRFGLLGTGKADPIIYFPLPVDLPTTVKRISAGADHTLFICD